MEDLNKIRNFVIIAHIDHGKSTLADRFLEITGTVPTRKMRPQYLDQLELERERGITIKMAPVRMIYHPNRGDTQNETQNDAEDFLYSDLTYKIRGAVFSVRKKLGLGHKEQMYHNALAIEFQNIGLKFESKKNISVSYDGQNIGTYQPDFIVEDKILVELKALPEIGKPQIEQLWSYLKGCDYKLALLINFGSKDLEIKRIVYDKARNNSFLHNSASSLRVSAGVSNQIKDNKYILNLIDTPGHSDFSYEVSRALAAVEGAILLVDATKGIQAQTLSNFRAAKKAGLTIIGAVNKIDLKPQHLEKTIKALADLIGVSEKEIFRISGKTGEGTEELLKAVIERVPPPYENTKRYEITKNEKFHNFVSKALIFDSLYDDHKGILAYVRVFSAGGGSAFGGNGFKAGEEIFLLASGTKCKIKELGYFAPELKSADKLNAGEIGYIATGLKEPALVKIGDTIIGYRKSDVRYQISEVRNLILPGYKEPSPVVFISFYPDGKTKYEDLKRALERLRLTDAALSFEPDANEALGRGFKAGFLGQLHFEITASRLSREFGLEFITSFPSIAYRVKEKAVFRIIKDAHDFPSSPDEVLEPIIKVEILSPAEYLSPVLNLKNIFELEVIEVKNISEQMLISGRMPLRELIRDFDDQLKSVSAGFASFSYELVGESKAEVEKLEILVAGEVVSALTRIIPKKDVGREARLTVERLKKLLPKEQWSQAIQASVRGRIIARETISALHKDVAGYLYGGDRTRKMKLWKKQKRGKEKLGELAQSRGRINIGAETFREILKK